MSEQKLLSGYGRPTCRKDPLRRYCCEFCWWNLTSLLNSSPNSTTHCEPHVLWKRTAILQLYIFLVLITWLTSLQNLKKKKNTDALRPRPVYFAIWGERVTVLIQYLSIVCIATRLHSGWSGIRIPGGENILLSYKTSRPALRPTQSVPQFFP